MPFKSNNNHSTNITKLFSRISWKLVRPYIRRINFFSPKLFESERTISLALKKICRRRIHYRRKSYRHCRKATESGSSTCWRVESARLFSTNSRISALSLSRIIRHSRWPKPKSVPPIRRHLSANIRNQFAPARYFPADDWIDQDFFVSIFEANI